MRPLICLSFLLLLLTVFGSQSLFSQENGGVTEAKQESVAKREKDLAKKERKKILAEQKAIEKGKKQHKGIQKKKVRKRMKRSEKKAKRVRENQKREVFWRRWWNKMAYKKKSRV